MNPVQNSFWILTVCSFQPNTWKFFRARLFLTTGNRVSFFDVATSRIPDSSWRIRYSGYLRLQSRFFLKIIIRSCNLVDELLHYTSRFLSTRKKIRFFQKLSNFQVILWTKVLFCLNFFKHFVLKKNIRIFQGICRYQN